MLTEQLSELKRDCHSSSVSADDGIRSTESYKKTVEKYYGGYMGSSPEDDPLPPRATDTTLDLHSGDY